MVNRIIYHIIPCFFSADSIVHFRVFYRNSGQMRMKKVPKTRCICFMFLNLILLLSIAQLRWKNVTMLKIITLCKNRVDTRNSYLNRVLIRWGSPSPLQKKPEINCFCTLSRFKQAESGGRYIIIQVYIIKLLSIGVSECLFGMFAIKENIEHGYQ